MMRRLDRSYTLSPEEVREAIFYWLANRHDIPVPGEYSKAVITWDETHKVYISWDDTDELKLIFQ